MDKYDKAVSYLDKMGYKEDISDLMIQLHSLIAPQVPAVAWTELFSDLDYSFLLECHAKRLAEDFTSEELDELLKLAESDVFNKLVKNKEYDVTNAENENSVWVLSIKDEFLSKAKYVFEKHKVDPSYYAEIESTVRKIEVEQRLKDDKKS